MRIEDITNIVGIKHYIECLSLNKDNLDYINYIIKNKKVIFNFKYDKHNISISIDNNHNIKDLTCDCEEYNRDYCKHVGLAVMYILQNEEIVNLALDEINNEYDEDFNKYLFASLNNNINKTKKLNLEVIFKATFEDSYELQIKIGETKTYVLKKQLHNFLNAYNSKEFCVEFGKNFTYNPAIHYFNEIDKKIIEFINVYVDSQNNHYNYYTNDSIILTNYSLKQFLKLIYNKDFYIDYGYTKEKFNGIVDNYKLKIDIKSGENSIIINQNLDKIIPFIADYSYIIINNEMIYIPKESRELLKILNDTHKKQLIFKEQDYSNFANILLPKLKSLNSNLDLNPINDKFKIEDLKVKYYFEKKKDNIVGTIKLEYNNTEINILDNTNNFSGIYVIRDKNKEQNYINELLNFNFKLNNENYILENEIDIVNFIENGLNYIGSKYDVYVSKNLKDVQIIKKINMSNTFSIGSNNILNYDFKVDNIDKKEITKIMNALVEKKKYYKLKNGNYLNIENNNELNELMNLFDTLDIKNSDILKDTIAISKYKSMQLENFEYVSLDKSVKELINNFKKYKNIDVEFDKETENILRDYQQIGIKWMLTISKCNFGGILADEMGLGKSLQTITYIKMKLKEENLKFLIIVPTSLIYNWENEFKKFAPNIKYTIINDTKDKRIKLLDKNDANVLITTYGLIRKI